nr:DNA repair protein RecO [Polycladospora coralii]
MVVLIKFEGIVLRARSYGESNQVLTIFTEQQGKMAIMARGSKKTKNRFGAVTEPFTEAIFVCYKSTGMGTLSQADPIASHYRIRADLLLTSYGAYWLELIDKATEENQSHRVLYHFLVEGLNRLEEGVDPDILTRMMELQILRTIGSAPILNRCASCTKEKVPIRFSVSQGGFLCQDCASEDPYAFHITKPVAYIMRTLAEAPLNRLGHIQVKSETKEQVERLIHAFINEYFPVSLKSFTLLNQIRNTWK